MFKSPAVLLFDRSANRALASLPATSRMAAGSDWLPGRGSPWFVTTSRSASMAHLRVLPVCGSRDGAAKPA